MRENLKIVYFKLMNEFQLCNSFAILYFKVKFHQLKTMAPTTDIPRERVKINV